MSNERKDRFVADGRARILADKKVQAEIRRVRDEVRTRYAEPLSGAGFVRRVCIGMKMRAEIRRQVKQLVEKIAPPDALYSRHRVGFISNDT